jgi:hypothetical protein
MYQGFFIDIKETDKRFAEWMSSAGPHGLKVKFQKPTEFMTQVQQILDSQPDLVALDYRLNEAPRPSSYTAGALAQQLRDSVIGTVAKDFPIILVSKQNDMNAFFDNITAHSLFDQCFTQEEIGNDRLPSQKILSLVKGYKHLIKNWNQVERWAILLGVTGSEKIRVGYQAIQKLDKLKAPHQVVRDILRYVIERPGILLDNDNLLAYLGVAKAGKDVDKLLEILREEKVVYSGVFSEGWTRWWRHRLERWEEKLCDEPLGNMRAKQRVSCLNQKFDLTLSPAQSRWQGHTAGLFAFACASCHQPTEEDFSVAVYDQLPLPYIFARSKSICWKCVETGEFAAKGLEIAEDEEFIAEKIRQGEIKI